MAPTAAAIANALSAQTQTNASASSQLVVPGVSPLTAGYNQWIAGRSVGPGLPRPFEDFLAGAFGPLSPIQPMPVDVAEQGDDRATPRRWQYPVGWNLPVGQPGTEGYKLVTFAALRRYADVYSVVRAMLDIRINELAGMTWDIGPTPDAQSKTKGNKQAVVDQKVRANQIATFFKHCDPNYYGFQSWFTAVLEDMFVIDAVAMHRAPTRVAKKGLFGTDLAGLHLINGETIRPLVDVKGSTPRPPAPAYQQYLWGVPRTDLMAVIREDDLEDMADTLDELDLDNVKPEEEYAADQLLYLPRTKRSWTPYGFSAIEKAVLPITIGLQRQGFLLDYFTEGSIPGVYVIAGDQYVTPAQQRQLQDTLNALAGDVAWKHRVIVLPPGSKTDPQKDLTWQKDVDQDIIEQVAMVLRIQPHEIGMVPGGRTSGLGGKGMSEAMSETASETRTEPDRKWWKETLFDWVIQKVFKQDDLEWKWLDFEEEEDTDQKANSEKAFISMGKISIDEQRIEDGLDPWNLPLTKTPFVIGGPAGIIPLDPTVPPPAAPAPPGGTMPDGSPMPPGLGGLMPGAPGDGKGKDKKDGKGKNGKDAKNGAMPQPAAAMVNQPGKDGKPGKPGALFGGEKPDKPPKHLNVAAAVSHQNAAAAFTRAGAAHQAAARALGSDQKDDKDKKKVEGEPELAKYSPDEARDAGGRWSAGGAEDLKVGDQVRVREGSPRAGRIGRVIGRSDRRGNLNTTGDHHVVVFDSKAGERRAAGGVYHPSTLERVGHQPPIFRDEIADYGTLEVGELVKKTKVVYKGNLTKIVYRYLLRSYPKEAVQWVKDTPDTEWKYDPHVKLSDINMSKRPGGRNYDKVNSISDTLDKGASMDPIVLVERQDQSEFKYDIADGWHRTLGAEKSGIDDVPAFIGEGFKDKSEWGLEMQDTSDSVKKGAIAELGVLRRFVRKGGLVENFRTNAIDSDVLRLLTDDLTKMEAAPAFERARKWVLKAGNPEALREWYNNGADGQIDWGSDGDFMQCVGVASDYMSEEDAKGFCNLRHQDAVGGAPGTEKTISVGGGVGGGGTVLAPFDLAGAAPSPTARCERCGQPLNADGVCAVHGVDVTKVAAADLLAAIEEELGRRGVELS